MNYYQQKKITYLKLFREIDTSKAARIDRLPGRFLKDGTKVLAKLVTDICHLSISLNKFPSAFKLAKVEPIFRKGGKTNVSNYRPISLLSILSKAIEKGVHEQTTKFLNDNNIFYKYQFGFRNNHSTVLFLSFPNDKKHLNLQELLPIGFSKNTISWYESYLAERHFTVEVTNWISKFSKISCGVLQGSILGPLLFLIYVNDMIQAVECDLYLYADNSCLLFHYKNVTEIKNS